jgi:hypothetical protein
VGVHGPSRCTRVRYDAVVVGVPGLHTGRSSGRVRDRTTARQRRSGSGPWPAGRKHRADHGAGRRPGRARNLGAGTCPRSRSTAHRHGRGVAVATVKLAKRDAPPTTLLVLGAAGSFAAISVIFGSPIIGARDRLTRLHRHDPLDRAEHIGLLDRTAATSGDRYTDSRRDRFVDRAGRRRRTRDVPDPQVRRSPGRAGPEARIRRGPGRRSRQATLLR